MTHKNETNVEGYVIRSMAFREVEGPPNIVALRLACGPDGGEPIHNYLVSRETLEMMAQAFLRQAQKMPHSAAGTA